MNQQENMIEFQLIRRGIKNPEVIRAMREVVRAAFVPGEMQSLAYADTALPIGEGQTISQPYIVAYMAQVLDLKPDDRVLEVGTGCGYNAAVLSRIAERVYSIEIISGLIKQARKNLQKLNIENIEIHSGDGYKGWPEKAPFDKIILTAATPAIPEPLKKQLKTGGKLLAPISDTLQKLFLLEKTGEGEFKEHDLIHVRFVPMTGESQS